MITNEQLYDTIVNVIENVGGHPVLVDLQFTQQHLPLGEQQ